MPFRSERQRRYLWMAHPDIARAWAHGKHTSKGRHKMPEEDRSAYDRAQMKRSRVHRRRKRGR